MSRWLELLNSANNSSLMRHGHDPYSLHVRKLTLCLPGYRSNRQTSLACFLCCLCRYNSSCYSSLLQQVDATADIELLFQQTAASPAAAQQQAGRYGVVWMHPDDSSRLSRAWVSTPQVVAPRRSFGGGMPVSGVNSLDAGQLGNMYGKDR